MEDLNKLLKELDDEDMEELEDVGTQIQMVPKNLPSQIAFNGMMVDVDDDSALTTMILTSALEDKKKADDLFDIFETNVVMSKDRSDSSKEALTKAVEIRVQATSNLVKILDIKNKSKQASGGLVNLQISQSKAGIDLRNITDNLD